MKQMKRMKRIIILSMFLLVAGIVFYSYTSWTEQMSNNYYVFADQSTVFVDQSTPIRKGYLVRNVFVLGDEEVFAQVAKFPGFSDRTYYQVSSLPPELKQQIAIWVKKKADIKPPFVMGYGPVFWIERVPRSVSKEAVTRYFDRDNEEISKFMKDISAYVIKEENQIQSPPEWVMQDKRIKVSMHL